MIEKSEQRQIVVNANYAIFILLLTLLSLVNSILLLTPLDEATRQVVQIIDNGICMILMLDFFVSLSRAANKRRFLFTFYGWLDFIGSLPLPLLRAARLVRLVLVNRELRRTDLELVGKMVIERRAQSTLLTVLFVVVLVFETAAITVLRAERGVPFSNIHTGSEALWWSAVTVATVGYGDYYPVTNSGRIVGLFLMTAGVGIFSALTSFLADWFRRPRSTNRPVRFPWRSVPVEDQEVSLRRQLLDLQRLLDEREAAYLKDLDEIRARLDEIISRQP
jgi:voltage-gated potassium channel